MQPELAQRFITALEYAQIFKYFHVASMVVLVYNFALTIDMEVRFIWNSKWSQVKILYLFSKYLPFFDVTTLLVYVYMPRRTVNLCLFMYKFIFILTVIGVAMTEALLTMQIWAVWGNSKKIIGCTVFAYVAISTIISVLLHKYFQEINFSTEMMDLGNACMNKGPATFFKIVYFLVALYDIAILVLLAIKALPAYKQANIETLSWVVYTDGLLFYICSIILIVGNGALPPALMQSVTSLSCVILSILACRSIVHIRKRSGTLGDGYDTASGIIISEPWQLATVRS